METTPGRVIARVADALHEPDDLSAARCGLRDIEVGAAVVGCKERERAPVVGVTVPSVVLRHVVKAERCRRKGRLRVLTNDASSSSLDLYVPGSVSFSLSGIV